MWVLLLFALLCDLSLSDIPKLLEELGANPSLATFRFKNYYDVVEADFPNDPDAFQLLGLVEYFRGNISPAYDHYLRCAELGQFSESYKHCILNCIILIQKMNKGEVDFHRMALKKLQYVLTMAPQFYVAWASLADVLADATLSLKHIELEIESIWTNLVPVGLILFPNSSELLVAQGLFHLKAGDPTCASAFFQKSLLHGVLATNSALETALEVHRTSLVFTVPNDVHCPNISDVPGQYSYSMSEGIAEVTGSETVTYFLAVLRIAKFIDNNYHELKAWNKFVSIHMQIFERDIAKFEVQLRSAEETVFQGAFFQSYQRLGISLFPRHPGLLFLQGLHGMYRGDVHCALHAFVMARTVSSGLREKQYRLNARVGHLLDSVIPIALNMSIYPVESEDMCYPFSRYSSCAGGKIAASSDVHPELNGNDAPNPGRRTVFLGDRLDCAKGSEFLFPAVTDKESLLNALSKCTKPSVRSNFHLDIKTFYTALRYNEMEYVFSEADFKCRVVQIGCIQQYCVKPGWLVVDADDAITAHVVANADNLSLAFNTESINVLYASHIFEHIPHSEAAAVLSSWRLLLTRGGLLLIAVPNLIAIATMLVRDNISFAEKVVLTEILYGGHEDQYNIHHSGYFYESLKSVLLQSNFCNVVQVESFGLFNDFSDFGLEGRNFSLSLNVIAVAC